MIREVLVFPNLRLRSECESIADPGVRQELFADLIETMYAKDGVGLAAPQIGEAVTAFVLNVPFPERDADGSLVLRQPAKDEKANFQPLIFVNPKILWESEEKETEQEGCLSFPGIFAPIERPVSVTATALNRLGDHFTVKAHGLYARAVCHEHDHLTGRLLVDLVGPTKREMIKKKMRKRGQ